MPLIWRDGQAQLELNGADSIYSQTSANTLQCSLFNLDFDEEFHLMFKIK